MINDIITILEQKNFIYIENFAVILLNPKLKDNSDSSNQANKENAPPKSTKMLNSKITSFFKVQPKKEVIPANSMQEETPTKCNDLKQCLNTLEDYSLLQEIDPIQLLDNRKAEFFYKSKKILLMFRRVIKKSEVFILLERFRMRKIRNR